MHGSSDPARLAVHTWNQSVLPSPLSTHSGHTSIFLPSKSVEGPVVQQKPQVYRTHTAPASLCRHQVMVLDCSSGHGRTRASCHGLQQHSQGSSVHCHIKTQSKNYQDRKKPLMGTARERLRHDFTFWGILGSSGRSYRLISCSTSHILRLQPLCNGAGFVGIIRG